MKNAEIIALAKQAAQCAIDAHGPDDCPSARVAYDFVRMLAFEECEGTDAEARRMWDGMALGRQDWRLFLVVYNSRVAELCAPQGSAATPGSADGVKEQD